MASSVDVRISPAKLGDAAPIAEMSRLFVEHGLPWSWDDARVRGHVLHPDCAVIVARDGRRLAGFSIMEFRDYHAHLNLLAVKPGYRDRGIGRHLVEWLEACARTAGIFEVRVELRLANLGAHRFYERLGYTDNGVRQGYYAGVEDARCMTHDLRVHPARQE